MKEKKYACGRTKEDGHLCCRRKHHWWNTKKVKKQFGFYDIHCRVCGHIILMTNCKNKKDVKLGW